MSLKGKNAIVTGASRGIGLAIARKFASHGANICLVARNQALLETVVGDLPTPHDNTHCVVQHDVGKGGVMIANFPSCNILVNCAGITQTSLLHATLHDSVAEVINTNLIGTISMTQAVSRQMLRRGGCVVNISSILATHPLKGTSVYSASKAGVEAFTKAMAGEYAGTRKPVRFNCLRLGLVDTEMATNVPDNLRTLMGNKLLTRNKRRKACWT